MENFHLKGSTYIPKIDFDVETNILEISGESYHEYTQEFFQPVFQWLDDYLEGKGKEITFNFRMTYFNTSSSRRFLEILTKLENYQREKSGNVTVNWYYEENDTDMKENGEEYADDVDLAFNILSYTSED